MTAFQYRPIRPRLCPHVLPYRRHFLRVAVRPAVQSIRPVCGGCVRRLWSFQGRFETARLSAICFRAAYFQIELAVNGSVMYQKSFDLVAYIDGEDAENRQRIKVDSLF